MNPVYPRIRSVCGETFRLVSRDACLERLTEYGWKEMIEQVS